MTVLFAYDYLLGFSREVEQMWQTKLRLATAYYIMTRYLPFFKLLRDVMAGYVDVSLPMVGFTSDHMSRGLRFCSTLYRVC